MITIYTAIGTTYKKFGLFGDEGAGFSLTETEGISIGGSNTFELRDGKFVKTQEIAEDFL